MTDQLRIVTVIGESDVAILAAKPFPARTAKHELGKSAPVEEDDRLFAAGMSLLDRFD
jgi:hypothetical protein